MMSSLTAKKQEKPLTENMSHNSLSFYKPIRGRVQALTTSKPPLGKISDRSQHHRRDDFIEDEKIQNDDDEQSSWLNKLIERKRLNSQGETKWSQ